MHLTPLTTAQSLEAEGESMSHCVSSYARAVLSGVSRIYHLTSPGHASTLELRHDYDRWRVTQNLAANNRPTTTQHQQVAKALQARYNTQHPQAHEDLLAPMTQRHQRELQEARHQARRAAEQTAPDELRQRLKRATARLQPQPQQQPQPGDLAEYLL